MPLMLQIIRNDEPLALRWGAWHKSVMYDVIERETGGEATLNDLDGYVVNEDITYTDPEDGEVLELLAGDQFSAWTAHR